MTDRSSAGLPSLPLRKWSVRYVATPVSGLVLAGLMAGPPAAAEPEPEDAGEEFDCPAHIVAGDVTEPDEAAALRSAASCDLAVEVTSARGSTERTWAQPSGTLVTEIYAMPRWVSDDSGNWVDLDTSLVPEEDGSIRPVATATDLRISGGGDGPFVTAMPEDGGVLSLTWPDTLPEPQIDGDTATYPNVYRGIDLTVTAGERVAVLGSNGSGKSHSLRLLAAGGTDNGGPGERDYYHPGYFSAYALDPDGNNVEAVCHGPSRRSAASVAG